MITKRQGQSAINLCQLFNEFHASMVPQAQWQNQPLKTFQKANRVQANFTLGAMMFQRAGITAEKTLPELHLSLAEWDLQYASPARPDMTHGCNRGKAVNQVT